MLKILLCLMILASAAQANAQFQENFDAGNAIPSGWSTINLGGANGWTVTSSVANGGAHSGTRAAVISFENAAHNDFLITPQIEVTQGQSDRFSFWVRSRDADYLEPYEVVLSTTNNTNADAFTEVLQSEEIAAVTWVKKEFDLSDYEGETVYIAIRATGQNLYALYVDDAKNDALTTCPAVTGFGFANAQTNAVTLNWDNVSAAYQYAIGPVSETNPNALTAFDVATNSATPDLEPGTTYKAWVRTNCSGSFGDWTEPITFTTLCAPIPATALPWTEGFENLQTVGTDTFPNCWTEQGGQWRTTLSSSFVFDTNARTGEKFLSIYRLALNDHIWSPAFSLQGGVSYDFSFYAAGYDQQDTWDAQVFVNTSANAANASALGDPFYTVGEIASSSYQLIKRTFTPPADGVYHFSIRVNEYTQEPTYLSFDDFLLEESALSTPDHGDGSFRFFPNPVTDVLVLSGETEIKSAEIFNMLGQRLFSQVINATQARLDLSALQPGTYVVKTATAHGTKTIKIAKQ
ncbi:T9SS-dependent choice-of-anchor J family protein [Flavobacterium selenitireducens]|uniref:T9SS-dependent choice-of-anchor J family protein n=1 Tax=Flavobacterium selenitireducens TaxID=2722704 RepID=UPI00168C08A7|nr:choice-of-anchor J domain-containing protein [Flavobacterium selenitireducens]MBD3582290.1 T9SS type A sorting domain-containing protein [Flavobacterium selenitireducens]